jgi:hypothetical protein
MFSFLYGVEPGETLPALSRKTESGCQPDGQKEKAPSGRVRHQQLAGRRTEIAEAKASPADWHKIRRKCRH